MISITLKVAVEYNINIFFLNFVPWYCEILFVRLTSNVESQAKVTFLHFVNKQGNMTHRKKPTPSFKSKIGTHEKASGYIEMTQRKWELSAKKVPSDPWKLCAWVTFLVGDYKFGLSHSKFIPFSVSFFRNETITRLETQRALWKFVFALPFN